MRRDQELDRRLKARMKSLGRTFQPPKKRKRRVRAAAPPAFFARVARERDLVSVPPERAISARGYIRPVRRHKAGGNRSDCAAQPSSCAARDATAGRAKRQTWPDRQDFKPARLAANRKLAREGYARSKGLIRPDGSYRDPGPLTGILDQDAAVQARLWFERQTRRAAHRHERQPRPEGKWWHTFFLTVIIPSGIVAPGQLYTTDIAKLRKVLQRYARNLPEGSFFGGMLEADYVVDHCAGVEHWQWHAHFIVVVPCRGPARGRPLVRKAFPVRADPARGVYRPVKMKSVRISLGGLRGAVAYTSKTLQIHGVHRKVITRNAQTGRRGKAQKQHLSPEQLAEWAAFAATVEADSLMVWSGYRRYGGRLVRTTSHGGGRKGGLKR